MPHGLTESIDLKLGVVYLLLQVSTCGVSVRRFMRECVRSCVHMCACLWVCECERERERERDRRPLFQCMCLCVWCRVCVMCICGVSAVYMWCVSCVCGVMCVCLYVDLDLLQWSNG